MPKGIKTVVVGIRVSPTVFARLQQRADRERRTISALALLLVEDGLDQEAAPGLPGAANGRRAPVEPPRPPQAARSPARSRDVATKKKVPAPPMGPEWATRHMRWTARGLTSREATILADCGCNTDADVLLLRNRDIKQHRKCGRLTFRRIKSFQAQLDMAESESLPPVSPATARHNRKRDAQASAAEHVPVTSWVTEA
jgi:hypothetical protein